MQVISSTVLSVALMTGTIRENSTLTNSILTATCSQRITTSVFKHSNDKVFHSEKTKLKEVAMENGHGQIHDESWVLLL